MNSIRSDLHEAVTFPLNAGVPVLTVDGKELGAVKEVREHSFKVDAPMRPDYWLARSAILSSTPERVTMGFEAAAAADYRLSGPGDVSPVPEPEPTTDPVLSAGHPILLDEDEQREQRERMERELEEQRQRLPNA